MSAFYVAMYWIKIHLEFTLSQGSSIYLLFSQNWIQKVDFFVFLICLIVDLFFPAAVTLCVYFYFFTIYKPMNAPHFLSDTPAGTKSAANRENNHDTIRQLGKTAAGIWTASFYCLSNQKQLFLMHVKPCWSEILWFWSTACVVQKRKKKLLLTSEGCFKNKRKRNTKVNVLVPFYTGTFFFLLQCKSVQSLATVFSAL